jgi:CysZ protein
VKGFFEGVRYLTRGVQWCARHPRQWLFGLIPALITLVLFVGALALLASWADDLAATITPFADDWSREPRQAIRLLAGIAIFGAAGFFALIMFTAVTLVIGQPFYEALAVRVEDSVGGAPPEPDTPLWLQLARGIRDGLILGVVAGFFALLFFALSFIPVIGQTVVPAMAACVSGYFLAGELTAIALERRGLRRKERFALLRAHRPQAVGFGAATVVLFLIPLGAVLIMPCAVAGATLLARERMSADPLTPAKHL